MLRSTAPRGSRAFALVETCMILLVLVAAMVICVVLAPEARRRARLAGSIANLQQLGKAAGAYATDFEDRVFSFSWAPAPAHECNGYVFPASNVAYDAAADQAVCIMRERGGRPDILAIRGWIPHILYSHLVLQDYLGDHLPNSTVVSPEDGVRLAWQRAVLANPANPMEEYWNIVQRPAGNSNAERRWAFSSSYELQPSFFSPDAQINTPTGPIPTVAQDPTGHHWYTVGSPRTVLGGRRFNEVRFPSHKAMMYDVYQRNFGQREAFFMYPEARVPVLFPEGSVSLRSRNRANDGFFPNLPLSAQTTRVNYAPALMWEPPTLSGAASELVDGGFRWTRSGLRGRDFAGPEVPWVP